MELRFRADVPRHRILQTTPAHRPDGGGCHVDACPTAPHRRARGLRISTYLAHRQCAAFPGLASWGGCPCKAGVRSLIVCCSVKGDDVGVEVVWGGACGGLTGAHNEGSSAKSCRSQRSTIHLRGQRCCVDRVAGPCLCDTPALPERGHPLPHPLLSTPALVTHVPQPRHPKGGGTAADPKRHGVAARSGPHTALWLFCRPSAASGASALRPGRGGAGGLQHRALEPGGDVHRCAAVRRRARVLHVEARGPVRCLPRSTSAVDPFLDLPPVGPVPDREEIFRAHPFAGAVLLVHAPRGCL